MIHPHRRIHTLKIRHVRPNVRIQGIDYHLPVCRTCDLDSAVDKTWRGLGSFPSIIFANVFGLWKEVGESAFVKLGLSKVSTVEKVLPSTIKGAVEEGKEGNSVFGENLFIKVGDGAKDLDSFYNTIRGSHVDVRGRVDLSVLC